MDFAALKQRCTPPPVSAFAVAVPLVEKADGWHLLYEVRSASLRRQAGEVCFPGGRAEPGEDAVACALRELQEETGLAPREVIGALPFLMESRGGRVCPVALVLPDTAPAVNSAEVADIFTAPLGYLRSHPPVFYPRDNFPGELVGIPADYAWWSAYDTVPVYAGLPYPLWGLTARITEKFIGML